MQIKQFRNNDYSRVMGENFPIYCKLCIHLVILGDIFFSFFLKKKKKK